MAWDKRYQQSAEAKNITDLRRSGSLKEAYDLSKDLYSRGNREETFMQAYSWVLYDCLKRYSAEGTKFHKDISAFCRVLAQIAKFPIDQYRDDLFIQQLRRQVTSAGWALRKENRIGDLEMLSLELCSLPRNSVLYTDDTARMLLIGLKNNPDPSRRVMNWLGFGSCSWQEFVVGNAIDRFSGLSPDSVASSAVTWALYDEVKIAAGGEENDKVDLSAFLRLAALMRVVDSGTNGNHEAVSYLVGKLVDVGWSFRDRKNIKGLRLLLSEAVMWSARSAMHCNKVLTMFYVGLKDDSPSVITLVEWYRLSSLGYAEFSPRTDGENTHPALAQELTKAYLGALMSKNAEGNYVSTTEQQIEGCNNVTKLMEKSSCADWLLELYSLGKLLTVVGRYAEARKKLATVVASKPNEAWSWASYGRAWEAESKDYFEECLFKGLSVSRDLQTSLSMHEAAARVFVEKGLFENAKAETELVSRYRNSQGWRPSKAEDAMKGQEWYESTSADVDSAAVYLELSKQAEEIVSRDLPWTEFYVEWKNSEKNLVGAVMASGLQSAPYERKTIKDKRVADSVFEGQCYRGHFGYQGRSLIGAIEECPESALNRVFVATYSGELDLVKDFGFARCANASVWISPKHLEGQDAKQFQNVHGLCRKVYREAQGQSSDAKWEWAATTLELDEPAPESSYKKQLKGELEIARKGFGFADDCYVSAELISKYQLTHNDRINFEAVKSWDSKKGRWSWKASDILEKMAVPDDEFNGYFYGKD